MKKTLEQQFEEVYNYALFERIYREANTISNNKPVSTVDPRAIQPIQPIKPIQPVKNSLSSKNQNSTSNNQKRSPNEQNQEMITEEDSEIPSKEETFFLPNKLGKEMEISKRSNKTLGFV
jgi:hypothetical protein